MRAVVAELERAHQIERGLDAEMGEPADGSLTRRLAACAVPPHADAPHPRRRRTKRALTPQSGRCGIVIPSERSSSTARTIAFEP
jgi:hypothetical protein